MNINLHLKIAAYALALVGLWAVTFTDYFSLLWPAASTGLVLLGWFYEGPRRHQISYRRIWMALGVGMLVFFPFNMALSRTLLLPAVHLSIFAQAYSLLNRKNQKTYRRMLIVSFAQILASTNLTSDLRFAVIIVAYCLFAVYFVLLLYIFNGIQSAGEQGLDRSARERVPQGLLLFSGVLVLGLLPLTLTFFYGMPRLRYALIARGNPIDSLNQMRIARQRTGFTRIVELGTYGRVQEDQTLALRVEIPDGRPLDRSVKWRNGALNIYDGVAWSSSRDYFRYFNGKQWTVTDKNLGVIYPRRHHLFITDELYAAYESAEQFDAHPNLLKQVFYLEVPFSENLFGADEVKVIQGPFNFGVGRDFNSSLYISNRQALPDLISYTAYSHIQKPGPAELKQITAENLHKFTDEEDFSDYVRKSFLQLPPSLAPEIRQLALQITENSETPYDAVRAIQTFLEDNYIYSLDLDRPVGDDPLYNFLFVSKTGHCEYFATAMTIMCRAVGIPARLARGFQQGEWNETGRFYEVRQKDGHAWVEVLFPDYGWVDFDPSPRALADEYFENQRSRIARYMSKRLLQLQIFWRQNVIGYNETRRLRLLGEIKNFVVALPRTVGNLAVGLQQAAQNIGIPRLVLIALVLLLVPSLLRFSRKFENKIPPNLRFLQLPNRNGNGAAFYGKMLKLLEKRKIVKPSHLTPREFLDLPPLREHPLIEDIQLVTSLYYGARYGGRRPTDEEMAAVQNTLLSLKRTNGHASIQKNVSG